MLFWDVAGVILGVVGLGVGKAFRGYFLPRNGLEVARRADLFWNAEMSFRGIWLGGIQKCIAEPPDPDCFVKGFVPGPY